MTANTNNGVAKPNDLFNLGHRRRSRFGIWSLNMNQAIMFNQCQSTEGSLCSAGSLWCVFATIPLNPAAAAGKDEAERGDGGGPDL